MLRGVIDRATEHARPLLVASAQRDMAYLLAGDGDVAGAIPLARQARAIFERLGASVEIAKLDAWAAPLGDGATEPPRLAPSPNRT
jgi:hypothetical protein